MPFTSETAKEHGAKGGAANKDRLWRKDWRTWGLEKDAQDKFVTPDKYWAWVRENMPSLHVQTVMKGVAEEVRATLDVHEHNVLICNFPEPRAINTSEPVQLELTPCASAESASEIQGVIIDVGASVEPIESCSVTADAGVPEPDEEWEE
jgi:hypothetical protein